MIRGLFTVFTSLVVGSTALIVNRNLFRSDYRHYATEGSIPLKETDVAHWTYLSSLLMFSEEGGENEGASNFFGIKKVVRDEENVTKIKLEEGDKVIDNAHRLRIKCYEHLNRVKKSPSHRDPSSAAVELIREWCFSTSPKFNSNFRQFKGFFDWEYNNNKRIFITTNKPTHPKSSTEVHLPGFFLVNLIPHMDALPAITNDSQENKVLKNFPKLYTTDFYACLYDVVQLYRNNDRYWIGYTDETLKRDDLGDNKDSKIKKYPHLCSSSSGANSGWMTYYYNITNPTTRITHYKIAKNFREIKELISSSQTPA